MRLRTNLYLRIAINLAAIGMPWCLASATPVASDNAADQAYAFDPTASWQGINPVNPGENPAGSDNGGFGFGVWDFAGGFHDPELSPYGELNHFIDGVDFPASAFNDLGEPAFGLTNANQPFFGYTARATRTFNPLQPGQTLSLDFDNPLLQPLTAFDSSGFLFRLNTGGGPVIDNAPIEGVEERFGLFTTSGFNGGRWYTTDIEDEMEVFTDTGVSDLATSTGAKLRFTLVDPETYVAEFVRLSDGAVLFSRTAALNNTGSGEIDTLEITLFSNGSGDGPGSESPSGAREFFFNNLEISAALSGLGGDYNNDGFVDAADYSVWRDNLAAPAGTLPNDIDGGVISSLQYETWRSNYGATSAPVADSATVVPEPFSLLLLSSLGICVIATSWRDRDECSR